jgi:hypothetical protein
LLDAIPGQLLLGDAQDRLDDLAAARIGEGLINALQLVEANESLKRELPRAVQLDELRNEELRDGITCNDSAQVTAPGKAQHVDQCLGAGTGTPDEPDCSHMGRAVDSHGEHFGSPGDLEDVINPAAGDFGKLG